MYLCNVNNKHNVWEDIIMITFIVNKRIKSFQDVCSQCERIFNLHIKGYGSDKMYELVENIFFKVLKQNGGY
jgi:hypothetical protein